MTATSEGGLALSNENLLSDETTHAHNAATSMPPPLPPLKPGWRQLSNLHNSHHKQQEAEEDIEADEEEEEEEEAIPSDSLYGSRGRNGPVTSAAMAPDFRFGGATTGPRGGQNGRVFPHLQQQPVGAELAHWSSHGYLAKDSPDQHRPRESPSASGYVLLRRQGDQMVASANTTAQQRGRLPPPPQLPQQQQPMAGHVPPRFGNNQSVINGGGGDGNSPSPKFGSSSNGGGGGGAHGSKYFSVKGLKHLGQLHPESGSNVADGGDTHSRASFMGDNNKYFSVDSSFLSGQSDLRARLRQANGVADAGDDGHITGRHPLHPPLSSADNSLDFYKSHSPLQPPSSLDFPPLSLPPYQRPPPPPPPSKPQAAVEAFASSSGGGSLANSKNISGI